MTDMNVFKSITTNFQCWVTLVAGIPDFRLLTNTHISFWACSLGCVHGKVDGIVSLWTPVLDVLYFKIISVPQHGVFDIYSIVGWAQKELWQNSLFSSSDADLFPQADRLLKKINKNNSYKIMKILWRITTDKAEMRMSRKASPQIQGSAQLQHCGDKQARRCWEQTLRSQLSCVTYCAQGEKMGPLLPFSLSYSLVEESYKKI